MVPVKVGSKSCDTTGSLRAACTSAERVDRSGSDLMMAATEPGFGGDCDCDRDGDGDGEGELLPNSARTGPAREGGMQGTGEIFSAAKRGWAAGGGVMFEEAWGGVTWF